MTILAVIIAFVIFAVQGYYFYTTGLYISLYNNFFLHTKPYDTYLAEVKDGLLMQINPVGSKRSDLRKLIAEINHYVMKTKGTTDFSIIQNKVERKLSMRHDQSSACLAFPTFIGLMGTFLGVFLGILMFNLNFDGAGNITDDSIKNLLYGVLVSMSTSLMGLILTTINNARISGARQKIEEDKNDFYDFVQTELMPALDVSMVAAITKLHETVDRFEPAFDGIINRFQTTFDNCTRAFGDNFEKHVVAVAGAVEAMGKNMDKINENIELQECILESIKSDELVRGMDKYIQAAAQFAMIVSSLNKFEQSRRMMLEATKEAINLQTTFNESLKVPREVALSIARILDRIKDFEKNINEAGKALTRRDVLGNDVVEAIQDQIKGISKKGKIADKYLDMADSKLEHLFNEQTKVINEMNTRYRAAIEGHIDGFEQMLKAQTADLQRRHDEFMQAIEERFRVEDVRQEFIHLRRLEAIEKRLNDLANNSVKPETVHQEIAALQKDLKALENELSAINTNTKDSRGGGFSLFGRSK